MPTQMLFTMVRITTVTPQGVGSGTGFLLSRELDSGTSAFILVANKHVIKAANLVALHLIAADQDGSPALGSELTLKCLSGQFTLHTDPAINVAMIRLDDLLEGLSNIGTPAFSRTGSMSTCATSATLDEYELIETVTFIGYPNGLYDSTSFLPIVRQGFAATAMNIDYEGKPIFLIDASIFPGSSGSPVFLVPYPFNA